MTDIIEFTYKGSEQSFRNLVGIDERAQAIALKQLMQVYVQYPQVLARESARRISASEFDSLLHEVGSQMLLAPAPEPLQTHALGYPQAPPVVQQPLPQTVVVAAAEPTVAQPTVLNVVSNDIEVEDQEAEEPGRVFQRRLNLAGLAMAIVSTAILVGTLVYFSSLDKGQAGTQAKPSQDAAVSKPKPSQKSSSRQSVVDKVESLFGPIAPGGK